VQLVVVRTAPSSEVWWKWHVHLFSWMMIFFFLKEKTADGRGPHKLGPLRGGVLQCRRPSSPAAERERTSPLSSFSLFTYFDILYSYIHVYLFNSNSNFYLGFFVFIYL
jgi:hypothetical protein